MDDDFEDEEQSMSRTTSWASNAAVNGDMDESEDTSRRKVGKGRERRGSAGTLPHFNMKTHFSASS